MFWTMFCMLVRGYLKLIWDIIRIPFLFIWVVLKVLFLIIVTPFVFLYQFIFYLPKRWKEIKDIDVKDINNGKS